MLKGLRVVELAVWVAGPGGVLADWGAEVVKIEPPEGDPCRNLFVALAGLKEPKSPPFDLDNRGKKSVVLDTRTGLYRAPTPGGAPGARWPAADPGSPTT